MRSPMPNTESCLPGFILNGAAFITHQVHNRLLTPRVLYSIHGLVDHGGAVLETVWAQLPLLSREMLRLLYIDFSMLFLGYALLSFSDNRYAAYESQLPVALSYFVASCLVFFRYTLLLMAWLQKPQSWIHSSVLLLKLPDEWRRMPKEGVPKLEVSCCNGCNKLREIKGDIRSTVLYFFQQLVLSAARLLPLGSVLSFIPHVLMTGRMLAEYRYRTEGVCDRHIEKTYQQHWEFFAVLGLGHFFGVVLSSFFLKAVVDMPNDAFEPCISGLVMLVLVRLTYGMKDFPRPVEHAIRHFPIPDPTRWVVESGIDFAMFKVKQSLRDPNAALAFLDAGHQKVIQLQQFFLYLRLQYQLPIKQRGCFSKVSLSCLFPPLLRGTDHFFNDPIAGGWCLNQLGHWKNTLVKILEYRRLLLAVRDRTEFINRVRQGYVVKFFLFFFGGIAGTINDIFTLDFVVNRCPNYIRDFLELMNRAKQIGLITETWYQETADILNKLKMNLEVIKRVLNELPESSSGEFFSLLEDWRFRKYLISIIGAIDGSLVKYHAGLEVLGYDVAEIPDPETTFRFPDELPEPQDSNVIAVVTSSSAPSSVSAAFFAVPPLPRANSMDEWDDSDRRLESHSQAPLPATNSDDDWDDSDHHLVRKM